LTLAKLPVFAMKQIPDLQGETSLHLKEEPMASIMGNLFASGRVAWIAGIVLGVILLVIGIVASITILDIVGGIALAVSIIFLLVSYKTGGGSD
jgi:hypothetical protein